MSSITTSAPGKLMLLGEHAVVYGKLSIVTAVNQRLQATLTKSSKDIFELDASEVNIKDYTKPQEEIGKNVPKGALFVEIAVKNFFEKFKISHGVRIETYSDFSSKFGFGSSSATVVCVLKGLSELFQIPLSNQDLFDLAYKTVLDIQGKGSGFDVAAAIWGGTLAYVKGGQVIRPIEVSRLSLIVGYTGIKADTVSLIKHVEDLKQKNPDLINTAFEQIENIVHEAERALYEEKWERVGGLMNQNQQILKEKLQVSSKELDKLIRASLDNGAYGAKLSGAGGGDCMIALVEDEKRENVEKAIEKSGGLVLDVMCNAKGVSVEKSI